MTTTPALNDDLVREIIAKLHAPALTLSTPTRKKAIALIEAQSKEIEALRSALEPFAAEADQWVDSVPDEHRSLCTEPGSDKALFGSETVFTLGDLRRARTALKGAS